MSWKKNVFSYVIWLAYVLFLGVVLFRQAELIEELLGSGVYVEILAVIGALAVAGGMVLLLHLFASAKQDDKTRKEGINVYILLESALVALLLLMGLALRFRLLPEAGEPSMYFEIAKVADGREIPQIVHGASYVYLILLRGLFLFLGNKISMGIWMQIVIQLLAALLLFFGVRKLSGPIAALIFLFFITCSDMAVQDAVILSPRILFSFLFALGISLLCACKTKKLQPCLFLLSGILAGVIGWMDAGGILLMFIGIAIVFSEWEQKPSGMRRVAAIILLLLGCLVSFLGLVTIDVVYNQSTFENVLYAWLQLYRPEILHINLSVGDSISPWGVLLVVLLLFNLFIFWRDKQHERMCVWVVAAYVAVVAEYFGLLTEELPATMYLFFSLTVLAGIGVQECFRKEPERVTAGEHLEESKKEAYSGEELKGQMEEPKGQTEEPKGQMEESKGQMEELKTSQGPTETREAEKVEEEKKTRFIENPLPLPKPHIKKVLDFDRNPSDAEGDFDHPVDENDDFDIK